MEKRSLLKKGTIKGSLVGFSLFIIVTFLVLAVLMTAFLRTIGTNFEGFYHVEFVTEQYQMEIRKDVQVINKRLLFALVSNDPEVTADQKADLEKRFDKISGYFGTISKNLNNADLGNRLTKNWNAVREASFEMISLIEAGDMDAALEYYNSTLNEVSETLADSLDETGDLAEQEAEAKYNKTMEIITLSTIIFLVTLAVIIAITVFISLHLIRSIGNDLSVLINATTEIAKGDVHVDIDYHKQNEIGEVADQLRKAVNSIALYIDDISEVMSRMAAGQFNVRFQREFNGDFRAIQDAVNRFTKDISDSMYAISTVTETVSGGSTQMAEGSHSLANGTTEQASAIEEISATIQDVSTHIAATAESALQAGALSEKTQVRVNEQDTEIQNMLHAMSEISDTSKEIEKIIKTIEDIAFQTNILALNAAVEAARAGAAGKGFAVVADEVRNLANKSQEAAQSTSTLITAAISAVGKGSEIAGATAESMKEVKDMSTQTAKLIVDIAEASQEQSNAIKQITAGIDQISQVIQTNAATAEETSALCSSLNGQSNQLHERVARFELRRD
ncbi:MAG: HAMP domain-containing protein [Ruminococcaceae bacterium]|nr:HAMP domain-containing protein [Oscillospiraceae bacterium]